MAMYLLASTIPNCVSYDATSLMSSGDRAWKECVDVQERESVFLITTMNENYTHPEMPKGSERALSGLYLLEVAV